MYRHYSLFSIIPDALLSNWSLIISFQAKELDNTELYSPLHAKQCPGDKKEDA